METDLNSLMEQYAKNSHGVSLITPNFVADICSKHGLKESQFVEIFAEYIAVEFNAGEISYSAGDQAMNDLYDLHELSEHTRSGFPLAIYDAFDSGEFARPTDAPDEVPWQKYTLPMVRQALAAKNDASA